MSTYNIVLVVWVLCGIVVWGIAFASFQGERPAERRALSYRIDLLFAILTGLGGPVNLVLVPLLYEWHGFKFF